MSVRLVGSVAVLVFIGLRLGVAPFQDGLRAVTLPAIGAAVTISAVATVLSGVRWQVVARGLGVCLALPAAIGAYYRSQFLNSVLPGGVLGDVHRGVAHGQRAGAVGRGLRAVAWERFGAQVVQAVMTCVVLVALPSPVRPVVPSIAVVVIGTFVCAVLAVGVVRRGRSRLAAAAETVAADVRHGLLNADVWPRVTVASMLVVVGRSTTFVIAARIAGCSAPTGELIALAMLVQTAMVIPASVGGWGLREGAAAWAFAAAGLGANTGVSVTTAYAVLSLASVAPGAGLLLADAARRVRGDRSARDRESIRFDPDTQFDLDTPSDPVAQQWEAIRG
jgi:uncharacterized membrane protein YbhN (UPF0104 family)